MVTIAAPADREIAHGDPKGRTLGAVRDFYSEHLVRGRRPYYCTFCRRTILMGEQHVHVASCSCGTFATHRAHVACHEAASGRRAWEFSRDVIA